MIKKLVVKDIKRENRLYEKLSVYRISKKILNKLNVHFFG